MESALAHLLRARSLLDGFRDQFGADANVVLTLGPDAYSVRIELPLGVRVTPEVHALLASHWGEPLPRQATTREGRACDAHAFRSRLDGCEVVIVEYRTPAVAEAARKAS